MKITDTEERRQKFKEFEKLVSRVQFENGSIDELYNLKEYLKIDHESCELDDRAKHESVLKFQ